MGIFYSVLISDVNSLSSNGTMVWKNIISLRKIKGQTSFCNGETEIKGSLLLYFQNYYLKIFTKEYLMYYKYNLHIIYIVFVIYLQNVLMKLKLSNT